MNVQQRHATAFNNPVQLSFPEVDGFLLEDNEEIEVLHQGVRDFDVTAPARAGLPERKDRVDTLRLRFKGVGVERGRVVKNVQIMQPIEVMVHESRSEPDRVPLFQIMIYPIRVGLEGVPGPVEFSIVLQIMHADLESIRGQVIAQFLRRGVIAFRDEIEGGVKAKVRFKFHEVPAAVESSFSFHVVRENESEVFSVRPATPPGRRLLTSFLDWPGIGKCSPSASGTPPTKG